MIRPSRAKHGLLVIVILLSVGSLGYAIIEGWSLLDQRGIRHVRGDATDDASLAESGIERARALATILPHDADNLFVTLSARKLRDDMAIVARASVEKNEPKMVAAGANRVLNPYRHGGHIMAQQLLHPVVTEFMDVIVLGVRHPDQDLIFNPPSEMKPRVGDVLVVLGHRDNLHRLESLAGPA